MQVKACVTVEYFVGEQSGHTRWAGGNLRIEINKADGERVTFEKTTNASGCTEIVTGTFKVYKEQPVNVITTITEGTLPGVLGGGLWDSTKYRVYNNFARLDWGTLDARSDFGDTYYWEPVLDTGFRPLILGE